MPGFRLHASKGRRKQEEIKKEVGWCEMDQTMDVRKALLFSTQLQANKKRHGGGAGVCDNVQLFKNVSVFVTFWGFFPKKVFSINRESI